MAEVVLRYAKALFDAAADSGRLLPAQEDARLVRRTFLDHPELMRFLRSPEAMTDQKTEAIERIFAGQIGEPVAGFLYVVIRKNRVEELIEMLDRFEEMVQEDQNLLVATVTSAKELSAEERDKLLSTLTRSTQKKVILDSRIDPSLIGGLVVRIKDKVYDNSIRSSLAQMAKHLKGIRITEDKVV